MASEKTLVPVTKGGDLIPISLNQLPYTTTTENCCKYLQRKMDAMNDVLRNNGKNPLNVQIKLSTQRASKNFFPMILVLPTSVLDQSAQKNSQSSIFDSNSEQKMVPINRDIYETILKKYMYDKNSFTNPDYFRNMGISRQSAESLRNHQKPRIRKFGNEKFVICLIDPLKLFHEMLEDQSSLTNGKNFIVSVNSVDKMNDGNYRYSFKRSIENVKKDKGSFNFERGLASMIKETK